MEDAEKTVTVLRSTIEERERQLHMLEKKASTSPAHPLSSLRLISLTMTT